MGRHGQNQVGHALAENKKNSFYGYRVLVLIRITDSEFSLFLALAEPNKLKKKWTEPSTTYSVH